MDWPYREIDPLGGLDPYASSKACAEIVSAAYRTSFFPPDRLHEHHVALATARAGNVIGGGDWSEDRLIPDLVRGFCSGQPVLIRRPNAIRSWQHVLESLHGYMMLAQGLSPRMQSSLQRSTSDRATRTSGRSSASRPSWYRCGAMARPGLEIPFPACMGITFFGWMPARRVSNSDGNQDSKSKRRWSGRWHGIALGIKVPAWQSSLSSKFRSTRMCALDSEPNEERSSRRSRIRLRSRCAE